MNRKLLSVAVACALFGGVASIAEAAKADKSPHSFRRNVEFQARSNTNISLAPSSNSSFDFASLNDFEKAAEAEEDSEEEEEEDEDEDDDDFGDIDDIEGSDYDELELAESDNPDEDGDGVDDLIDDDQDTGDGDDEGDDDDDDDDDEGGSISKATRKKSSSIERYTGKFGVAHKYQVSKTTNYNTSLKVTLDRTPSRGQLDKVNLAFSTGPEFKLTDDVKLKTGVNYVRLQQDSNKFLSTFVGSVGLDWDVSKKFGLGFNYNYQDKDVTDPDSPDAIVNTLTFNADWTITKNDILKLKYSPTVEDSSITTRDKDNSGFEIAYSRKLPWDTVLGIGFKHDEVDYEKLPTPRSDEIDAFAVQLETEFSKKWSGSLAYENRKLDSNINSKDGKNRSVLFSVEYKF